MLTVDRLQSELDASNRSEGLIDMSTTTEMLRNAVIRLAPEAFHTELNAWVNFGFMPEDDLLVAILENDLGGVLAHAARDRGMWNLVCATQNWLWMYAPARSYGSDLMVEHWKRTGGLDGESKRD